MKHPNITAEGFMESPRLARHEPNLYVHMATAAVVGRNKLL